MSIIEYQTIDAEFPVAGVDNDTQGFRDNFQIIKTGFETADAEIRDLKDNTAKLNTANNFDGSELSYAQLAAVTEKTFSGTMNNTARTGTVDFNNGHYHTITVEPGDAVSINLQGWPVAGYAKMVVHLTSVDDGSTNTINVDFTSTNKTLKTDSNWPANILLDPVANDVENGNPIIVEFWTYDNVDYVYGRYLGVFS